MRTQNKGPLAHLVERFHGMEEASGSNPLWSTLTKIEGGVVTKPSVQTIAKIAKSLGVSMEELIK